MRESGAAGRLFAATDRDRTAERRDREAAARDAQARVLDLYGDPDTSREDMVLRAERDRSRAAIDRARAAEDRVAAAADRARAAAERAEAQRVRSESADTLKLAATDELTGAWTRKFGLEEASRELERAHRTGVRMMLAFIDIDGLKQTNDRHGHLAGDELLRSVGTAIRRHLRPYDVTVRYGGDEFVCAMPNLNAANARERFETIAGSLEGSHSFTVGIAASEPGDGLQELIARADADLLTARTRA